AEGDDCSIEKAMGDFKPEEFFNGTWYLAHGPGVTSPAVCQKFTTSGSKGFTQIVEIGYNKFESNVKFQCNQVDNKNGEQYSFKCKSSDNTEFEADFTFISVSYDNFALVCRSITFTSQPKEDRYLVFERTKSDTDPDAKEIC
uniref:TRIABIN n=1 Tax=Meccus pallidipennis TaxID=30077 RepID=UPI000011067D|nr:Chain I, TRIABIN [Meccus pallidipennis]